MEKVNDKKTAAVLVLAFLILMVAIAVNAEALEPKLLWEKQMPFEVSGGSIEMAAQSGDVIVFSQETRKIILYDKNGNKRFQWGPRIDRQPIGADISDDGRVILYKTSRTEETALRSKTGDWDRRIHYAARNGKELWNKAVSEGAYLSPDGKLIAVRPSAEEGENLTVLDSQGKVLWKYVQGEIGFLTFSPESNYILFSGDDGVHLFDKAGNLIWKKADEEGGWSVSENASYISPSKIVVRGVKNKKLYDKQGTLILEGATLKVSRDGKRVLISYPDKMSMLSLPDKTVIKDFNFWGGPSVSI